MDDTLKQMVEDYFEMESFGVKLAPQVAASDGARAQRILEDTTVKVGRRYQTGLLWKDDVDNCFIRHLEHVYILLGTRKFSVMISEVSNILK